MDAVAKLPAWTRELTPEVRSVALRLSRLDPQAGRVLARFYMEQLGPQAVPWQGSAGWDEEE